MTAFAYIGAALAEIAGCFAFWAWLRLDKSPAWLIPGMVSLALFAYLLYNNLMTISQAWIASGRISFALGLAGVHLLMLAALPILFYRRIAIFSMGRLFR